MSRCICCVFIALFIFSVCMWTEQMPFIDQESFNKLVSVACHTSLQCDQAVQLLSGLDNFYIYDKLCFYFTKPVSGWYFKAAKIDIYLFIYLFFVANFLFCVIYSALPLPLPNVFKALLLKVLVGVVLKLTTVGITAINLVQKGYFYDVFSDSLNRSNFCGLV